MEINFNALEPAPPLTELAPAAADRLAAYLVLTYPQEYKGYSGPLAYARQFLKGNKNDVIYNLLVGISSKSDVLSHLKFEKNERTKLFTTFINYDKKVRESFTEFYFIKKKYLEAWIKEMAKLKMEGDVDGYTRLLKMGRFNKGVDMTAGVYEWMRQSVDFFAPVYTGPAINGIDLLVDKKIDEIKSGTVSEEPETKEPEPEKTAPEPSPSASSSKQQELPFADPSDRVTIDLDLLRLVREKLEKDSITESSFFGGIMNLYLEGHIAYKASEKRFICVNPIPMVRNEYQLPPETEVLLKWLGLNSTVNLTVLETKAFTVQLKKILRLVAQALIKEGESIAVKLADERKARLRAEREQREQKNQSNS